jgi:hypothetical protein
MLWECPKHVYLKPCVYSESFHGAVHHCVLKKNEKNIQTVSCSFRGPLVTQAAVGYVKTINEMSIC